MAAYQLLDDPALTALLRSGDHAAFNEIYDRHWQILYQAAYNLLKDKDDAHDVVQEIFVWLWTNRESQYTDQLLPYLRAAVKYQIAKMVRHSKVKNAFYDHTVANYKPGATEEQSMEVRELKKIIEAFTAALPQRAREIYRLSREEMLTNRQIAERLQISEKTVENQMTINLRKLRGALGKMSIWCVLL